MNKLMLVLVTALLIGCQSDTAKLSWLREEAASTQLLGENNEELMMVNVFAPSTNESNLAICLYLHDRESRGSNNECISDSAVYDLVKYIENNNVPALVVVPQCPKNAVWSDDVMIDKLNGLVESLLSKSQVDSSRIYLTGFGMGGEGAWNYALRYPENLSTVVPVCGGQLAIYPSKTPNVPTSLADVNIWAFHYLDDRVVSPDLSKKIVSAIWTQSVALARFTEFVSGGHTADIYKDSLFLGWLFSTRRATSDL